MGSTSLSRENFLEKKIQILDKRLTQVEKFIALRFQKERESLDDEDNYLGSRSRKLDKREIKPLNKIRTKVSDSDELEEDVICLSKRTLVNKRQREESVTSSRVNSSKKYKPGPASVKKKLIGDEKLDKQKLKECSVRLSRTKVLEPNVDSGSDIPSTSLRGRPRRIPKRYQEDSFEIERASYKDDIEQKSETSDGDHPNVVKVEESDDPGDSLNNSTNNEDGADEAFGGLTSSLDDDRGDYESEQEGEYFTFSSSQSLFVEVGAGKRSSANEKKEVEHEDDSDWQAVDDSDREDESETEKAPAKKSTGRRGRPPTKRGASRVGKKRGKYNVLPKVEHTISKGRRSRSHTIGNLSDLPPNAITNSDPTMKLCHLCSWHFKEDAFEAHLESHAKERHLKCAQCGKAYFNQFSLKKHMKSHEPEKYTKNCRLCSKPFLHADKLLAHERYCVKKALEKNETVNPEILEDLKTRTKCSEWIQEAMKVGARLADSGGNPEERKECEYCHKHFKVSMYERHVLTHTKPRNWKCTMCEKAYHYKSDLVRHVSMDHVMTPTCEYCEKTFESRTDLKSHLTPCRREYKKGLRIKSVTSLENKSNDRDKNEDQQESKVNRDEGKAQVSEDNMFNTQEETEEVSIFAEEAIVNITQQEPTLGLVGGTSDMHENEEIVL